MTIQTYNEQFLQELERLNPAQREAVETIEGPVLVIAGPGTGKTHILAARIGNILLRTDAQPHNILCLTFTDAGVQAMRHRLLSLIGPDAHKVHIFTFHSFCNTVIQDNLELFGRRELEPLSDLERVETIRQLLDEVPWAHPLRRGRSDGYRYERHLQELFRRMKSENWGPNFIEEKINAYLADLPNRKEFVYQQNRGTWKKGDLKTAAIEEEKLKMERLRSAVQLFPRYEDILRERRRYDYEDMILWVLRAFRDHPYLLARYQEQYLYFLLDEYQDTNGAQNEVLHRLTEFWDAPNVFIVGDDDQSIYEFQGARLKNITDFYHTHHDELKVVVLTENYRSTQHILDSAGTLIGSNTLRIVNHLRDLGLEKVLIARHAEYAHLPILPSVKAYPNRLQEEVAIAEQLEKLLHEGFPLDEVAVIFAKHRQAKRLMALLEKKGIPYQTRQPINALDLPLVENLRLMLSYFVDEFHRPYCGEQALFRMLHFEFFGIKPQDIARLSMWLATEGEGWTGMEKLPSKPGAKSISLYLRSAIANRNLLKQTGIEQPEALLQLSVFLEFMLSEYANLSVPHFIERLINRSGLLHHVLASERKAELLQVLFAFTNFVENEALRNPRIHLTRLLEIFASMDANGIGLRIADYGLRVGATTPVLSPPNSTQSAVHSPQSTVGSPQLAVHSPQSTVGSPKLAVHSPQSTVGSPKLAVHSPQSTVGSPKLAVHIPQSTVGSPQLAVHSPQSTVGSPKLAVHSPQSTVRSQGQDSSAFQSAIRNPEVSGQVPQSAIQLLTAHSSKGLEFRHVFLLDCVKDNWEPAKRGSHFQFTFPDTLHLSGEADAMEARRRLFYVAMTRAKERLHISYATKNDEGKDLLRTQFLDEILGKNSVSEQPGGVAPIAILEAQAALLLEGKPTEGVEPHDRMAVQALLEKFTLNVTAMNKFLRCPLSFYYENVLRAPAVATEAAFYGVAMHNALRRGFEQMLRAAPGNRHFPFAGEFVQFFEHEMRRQQGFLSKKDFERRLDLGRQYLADYVRQHQASWPTNCKVEQEFNYVEVEGVPIMGIIDRIDYLGKSGQEVHIVDYKTGGVDPERVRRPDFELAVRSPQSAVGSQGQDSSTSQSAIRNPQSAIGGTYYRQLVFYKILFDNWRRNPARAISAEISYLEPDARGQFETKRIEYQPEDVAFVKGLITDTYARIMRQEFYQGCGQEDCSWCRFLKQQQQVDSFADVEGEGLDD